MLSLGSLQQSVDFQATHGLLLQAATRRFPKEYSARVPDILPAGSIRIGAVWINDEPYSNFEADRLTVKLPDTKEQVRVKVRIDPIRNELKPGMSEVEVLQDMQETS